MHVILRNVLIFFVVIFTALFFWLKSGVTADNLVLGRYKIGGLYIKLDKKLTLKANNIVIPKNKDKPSFKSIDETFDNIKDLFTFFDYIELKDVQFEDNLFSMLFADNILSLSSDDYEIEGNIARKEQKLIADISSLYLKKDDIRIRGKLSYNLLSEELETKGNFSAYNIDGNFSANKIDNIIDFRLVSDVFSDLKTLIEKFHLKPAIKSWVLDKVKAKKYQLYFLEGRGEISEDGFKMDFDTLKGEMLFDDVQIYYKEKLKPVLADSFLLSYKNYGLYFKLENPTYKKRSLKGSRVAIENILGKKPTVLKLNLRAESTIDDTIQEVLRAYKLNIPVEQKGAKAKLGIEIDIPLKESSQKTKIFVNVDLGAGEVRYKNISLPIKKGNVKYSNTKKNSIMLNATLKKGNLGINKIKLSVISGKIHYEKNILSLKKVHIKKNFYDGKVDGSINLERKQADLVFDAKHITLGGKDKFFMLKDKKIPLTLDYEENIIFRLPEQDIKITSKAKVVLMEVGSIKKIKRYLKNIEIEIDDGILDIVTKDYTSYTFNGIFKRKSCFFYDKSNICHTRVPFRGKVTKNNIDFYAFDKRLYFNADKSLIKLNDLNIDIKKFLESKEKSEKKSTAKKLIILGKKSNLRYAGHTLVTDSYDMEIEPNGNMKAIGSFDGDIVKFSKQNKILSIKALRIKDKMLHPLINFEGLKKGRYSLSMSGDPDKVIRGNIIVEGGVMSDFRAYNNTLAFINTIPALATLSSPGFSQKGFSINEGVIEYRMIREKIIFDSVYIKGSSATIAGEGIIDLKQKTINMNLAIQTARELGGLIGSLPVLGYIIMGKDKSMTVGLKITGSLNKPKIQTTAAEDVLTLPFRILKRVMESPAYIIKK